MTTVSRQEFTRQMQDRQVDAGQLKSQPQHAHLAQADLDGDGKIAGTRELAQLFRQVDTLDKDGSYRSIDTSKVPVRSALDAVDRASTPAPRRGLGSGDSGGAATASATTSAATSATTSAKTSAATARGAAVASSAPKGLDSTWRVSRDVDVEKLKDALPPQAKHLAQAFVDAGKKHGVDPTLLASISKHETGNWTSSAFRHKNNAMGISGRTGPLRMSSAAESIDRMAKSLASPTGYYKNAQTLKDLWRVYAPSPANGGGRVTNDPHNLNQHWGPAILKNWRELERVVT